MNGVCHQSSIHQSSVRIFPKKYPLKFIIHNKFYYRVICIKKLIDELMIDDDDAKAGRLIRIAF